MSWFKIKSAAEYSGVSVRTFRKWLKEGLNHSRLPTGVILIKQSSIDEYLEQFEVKDDQINVIVDEIMKDLKK